MNARKLSLKREALAELTADQLGSVVGAQVTGDCTGGCNSPSRLKCQLTLEGSRCIY